MKIHLVAAAISFCNPSLSSGVVNEYAKIVFDGSVKTDTDPLLIVAVIDRESRWQFSALNPKSGALGLGQILPQFRPACAGGNKGSAACVAEKKRLLLDGTYNLKTALSIVETWKTVCKSKLGTTAISEDQWLRMYSGENPKGSVCGRKVTAGGTGKWDPLPIPSVVKRYLDRRRVLRLRLEALPPGL
jgi:hypothetical protein